MFSFSGKITYFIFIAGAFVLISFVALNYQNLNVAVYSILYLSLLFLLFFGIFVAMHTAKPLHKIIKTANELADGNVKSRAHISNTDELGQLAKSLNKIAQNMERNIQEKEKIQYSVAMKVNSIVQPLHDTIEALEQKAHNRTMEFHRANEVAEKTQFDLLLKEAELVDLKGQMAKLMVYKNRKAINEEV
jgi:nitrogen fixation/metabolism regulation signal transduction histidine kinase